MAHSEPGLAEGLEKSLDGYAKEPTDHLDPKDYVYEIPVPAKSPQESPLKGDYYPPTTPPQGGYLP